MLSLRTILPDTLELLKKLSIQPELAGMRLVGGTSLALQYGHRQSIDLDFFGRQSVPNEEMLEMLRRVGDCQILRSSPNIQQVILDGIKVDVVNYHCYDWIDAPVLEENDVVLASPKDIAALKVNAIEGRGTKKDFIDIFVLLQHFSLAEILEFYKQKYPEHSIFRALMSLTYFEDADRMIMPPMFIDDSWEDMKRQIVASVSAYQTSVNPN